MLGKKNISGVCSIPRWQLLKRELNNLTYSQFASAMQSWKHFMVLDVRTASEYHEGHVPGALLFDYLGNGFYDMLESLDRSNVYLIYCRTGRKSMRVCTLMRNADFQNVYNLDNGIMDTGVKLIQ